jgi:putative YhbY family RNA-binding protein
MSLLSPAQRRELKGRAHKLHPLVLIGGDGLTGPVLDEIDRALAVHELIKVRAAQSGRAERGQLMAGICERARAQPVQVIGKVLVIFRRKPVEPPPPPREQRPPPVRRRRLAGPRKIASRRGVLGTAKTSRRGPAQQRPRRVLTYRSGRGRRTG